MAVGSSGMHRRIGLGQGATLLLLLMATSLPLALNQQAGSSRREEQETNSTPSIFLESDDPETTKPQFQTPEYVPSGSFECPSSFGFYPHELYCDYYYECYNGVAYERACPDGLVFNDKRPPITENCELPFGIDCRNRPLTQPAQRSEHCPRRWGMYKHETDCNKYYFCVDGQANLMACGEGLAYDEYQGGCDWPDYVDRCVPEKMVGFVCPEKPSEEDLIFGHPRHPHPDDCNKLFVCVPGRNGKPTPRLLSCGKKQAYNPITKECDDPANVPGCEPGLPTPTVLPERNSLTEQRARTSRLPTEVDQNSNSKETIHFDDLDDEDIRNDKETK